MQISLYRRYRPQKFCELIGQETAVGLLRRSLMEGRLGQAYLFSGPRGCGKTSAARIMAKAVNCERLTDGEPCGECGSCSAIANNAHLDVVEIDAASNNGVDFIRDLREQAALTPMMGRTKVYVLDEVHMLSGAAFNAFLKTLEEPPASVMFIMATTDPQKVPVTIRSRCQHVPFRRIDASLIASRVAQVVSDEGIDHDEDAVGEIARAADGAMRDALSIAEQAIAFGGGSITGEAVRSILGGGSRRELERFMELVRTDAAGASAHMSAIMSSGAKPERVLDSLFPVVRDMWLFSLWGEDALKGAALSSSEKNFIMAEAPLWTPDQLKRCARAVTRMVPRASRGLGSDIFSGLLLFDMIEARDGTAAEPSRPPASPSPRTSAPTTRPERLASAPASSAATASRGRFADRPLPVPPSRSREAAPPSTEQRKTETRSRETVERGQSAPAGPLPPKLASLEPHIAAALTFVSIIDDGGKLGFDLSRAPEMARSILSMPRVRAEIERAIGIERPGAAGVIDAKEPTPPADPSDGGDDSSVEASCTDPQTPPPAPPRRQTQTQRQSLGDKLALLGAEILMQRPIDTADDASDEDADMREDG